VTPALVPLVAPGAGDDVGFGMTRKITAAQTHGGLSVAHATIPPGAFVPPHVHTREDEATHVLSGEIHVVVGDQLVIVASGGWVLKPRGVFHAFWNAGSTAAHVIEVVTPATLDDYFAELYRLATAPGGDELARRAEIDAHHARYGITFDEARAQALRARYGLAAP
jgi:mannose-6-phosphate isomerase-like protein (cupin superfamily)